MATSTSIKELADLHEVIPWELWYHGDHPEKFRTVEEIHHHLLTHKWFACDTETISLDDREVIGLGLATSATDAFYWNVTIADTSFPYRILRDPSFLKVFHNTMFDMEALEDMGVHVQNVADSMQKCQEAHLPKGLADVSKLFSWQIDTIDDVLPLFGKDMLDVPTDVVAAKCAWDIRATYRLWQILSEEPGFDWARIKQDGLAMEALAHMHHVGMAIDQEGISQLFEDMELRKQVLHDTFRSSDFEFNPGSGEQVAYVLSLRGHFPSPKWDYKTRRKATIGVGLKKISMEMDEGHLLELYRRKPDPFILGVLEYRDLQKQHGTYVKPLLGKSRVNPHFHFDASTQRISGYSPNIMNQPSWIRPYFKFDDPLGGTRYDCNQQELRILQHLSGDPIMKDIFARYDDSGMKDDKLKFHSITAELMGCDYGMAKNTNFCVIYGGGVETIMATAGIQDRQAAETIQSKWATSYPVAWEWINDQKATGQRTGICYTATGRPLPLPEEGEGYGPVGVRKDLESIGRDAVNWPIQGTGADVLRGQMVLLVQQGYDFRIPIHDEGVLNGRIDLPKDAMARVVPGLYTPVETSYLDVWRKA